MKVDHDCEKPELNHVMGTITRKHGPFWNTRESTEEYIKKHDPNTYKYTCPCGAVWEYRGWTFYPSWELVSRPDKWEAVEIGTVQGRK
jgi:hypothetical protein